jgi:hypothetical protein
MSNFKNLPDDKFEDLLEELHLQNKTDLQVFNTTKVSQEKINIFSESVYSKWDKKSSINQPKERLFAKTEAQCDYLVRIAFESFMKSRKRSKSVYKNDTTNVRGPTIENHRIIENGPGDDKWLRFILEVLKYRGQLAKLDSINAVNDYGFDSETFIAYQKWLYERSLEGEQKNNDDS